MSGALSEEILYSSSDAMCCTNRTKYQPTKPLPESEIEDLSEFVGSAELNPQQDRAHTKTHQRRSFCKSNRSYKESSSPSCLSNVPSNTSNHYKRRSKTCYMCWCCCWLCSCKSNVVRSKTKNEPSQLLSNNQTFQEDDKCISHEDIVRWSVSFEKVLLSSSGRKTFCEFLKSEYSDENILFWLECEDLKRQITADAVEERARHIYENYISILSPKEVSLDSQVRDIINRNMVEPNKSTFDEAQLQIYTLMHRDSYPRFLNSAIYKRLLQQTSAQT